MRRSPPVIKVLKPSVSLVKVKMKSVVDCSFLFIKPEAADDDTQLLGNDGCHAFAYFIPTLSTHKRTSNSLVCVVILTSQHDRWGRALEVSNGSFSVYISENRLTHRQKRSQSLESHARTDRRIRRATFLPTAECSTQCSSTVAHYCACSLGPSFCFFSSWLTLKRSSFSSAQ